MSMGPEVPSGGLWSLCLFTLGIGVTVLWTDKAWL